MSRRSLRWREVKGYLEDVAYLIFGACILVIAIGIAVAVVGGAIHIWRDLL